MFPTGSLRTQLRLALAPAGGPRPKFPEGAEARPAAVLIPVIDADEPSIVFTKRADELSRHPGEISFPGGMPHRDDGDVLETALRETEEELGLRREDVDVLGSLDPLLTHTTGFWVVPFVGALESGLRFTPSPAEIAEVLEVPFSTLSGVEHEVEWRREDLVWKGYVYEIDGHTIWGATGRMLHEFLQIVRKELPWPTRS
jgi:8-oxo-dGTP pyrophosphatase MutT (NUDIX family)